MAQYKCFELEDVSGATMVRLVDPQHLQSLLVGELQEELLGMVDHQKPERVVIDFSRVEFCSSAVIDALIRAKKRVISAGGRLKLCDMRPEVREAFQILNLDGTVFDIHDTADQAAGAF